MNNTSIDLTGNEYEDGSNYSLSDNSVIQGGSTEAQFEAAERLLNMSNSYLLQLPDRPDQQ
ncbi:hypothetical protein D3C81_2311110 [compost metagenome]